MLNKPYNLENANSVLIAPCQVIGHPNVLLNTALYHCTYYCMLMSHAFNGLSILYHVTKYHPIK